MSEGFLSRWSRRKAGQSEEPEKQTKDLPQPQVELSAKEVDAPPPPTLEDVEKIDRFAPDFSAFMRPDVDPTVQQAALKKMFSDPHFNVMDGLDIYIDDYSKPDPLPISMLHKLAQSDMLKLFRKDKEGQNETASDASRQTDLISTQPIEAKPSLASEDLPVELEKKKT
jgi:hypothetical protein